MGHSVTGLIAGPVLLEAFASRHSLHAPARLVPGFAFLPLPGDDIDALIPAPQTDHAPGFTFLSGQLVALLATASRDGPIAYIETDYFGGRGTQGAALFSGGELAFGPTCAETGPVNAVLRLLGTHVESCAIDEFESLGLHRHRRTEDWLGKEA